MEQSGGVAVFLLFLLSILIMLLIPVVITTLMLSFHIYRVVNNDLNLKKGEDSKEESIADLISKKEEVKIEGSEEEKIEDSRPKKEEAKIGNLNLEKAEDTIKKKEEVGSDCSEKDLTINICINLPGNDDGGSSIVSAEGTEVEEDKEISKSTVYSCDPIEEKKGVKSDSERNAKAKTTIATKESDTEQLPDFVQSQELDKQIINKESRNPDSEELKSNTKQVSNSMQSPDLNKLKTKNIQYVSEKSLLDTSELEQINKDIAKKGYGKWMRQEWERIRTSGETEEVGEDEVILQYGEGNIRIALSKNKMYFIGVPAKERWRGCDFNEGAFKACYDVVSPVEDKMDYDIVRIDKLARMRKTDEKIHLLEKGKIQVRQVSSTN